MISSQWLCHDDSTINIVVVIIFIIIIILVTSTPILSHRTDSVLNT